MQIINTKKQKWKKTRKVAERKDKARRQGNEKGADK